MPMHTALLGELYLKKGAYPEAIDAFRSAFSAKPDDWQSRKNLVAAYHHYAQHLDSRERYNEADRSVTACACVVS